MSDSDRGERSALVACVCTVVVFLIGLWAGGYHADQKYQDNSQSYRPDLLLLEGSPEGYQAICNAPTSEGQADLCQQWRAAEAATNSANWTFWQFILGLVGLVGLVATVVYAIRAFGQTAIQARAALRANAKATVANKIARDMGHAQVRAYMTTSEIDLTWADGEAAPRLIEIKFDWVNRGQSPALQVGLMCAVEHVPSGCSEPIEDITKAIASMALGTAAVAPDRGLLIYYGDIVNARISADETRRWLEGETDIVVFSAAKYLDVFGVEHTSQNCDVLLHRSFKGRNVVNFRSYNHHNSDN